MKKGFAAIITTAIVMSTAAGCTKVDEAEKVSSPATTAAATMSAETLATIGNVAEGEYISCVKTYNSTEQDITSVQVKDSSMSDYGDNLLEDGDTFKNGEARNFYYDTENAEKAASAATPVSTASGELTNAYISADYEVKLILADQTELVLHSFPFANGKEVSIYRASSDEGGFGYLTYEDEESGDEISTYDTEKGIYDSEQAAAQQAAEAEASASAAAAEQAAAEQAAAEQAAAEQAAAQAAAEQAAAEQAAAQAAAEQAASNSSNQQSSSSSDEGCLSGGVILN